jgi:hypothetical protein
MMVDTLWESMFLEKYPNASKHQILEAKKEAVIEWAYDENTEMAELYDKYVTFKRLQGIEPGDAQ